MSTITQCNIQRPSGNLAYSNIIFQIDHISVTVIAGSGGAIPWNSYDAYSLAPLPDIRLGDIIIDQQTKEPVTGQLMQWRVSGNPEYFPDHVEVQITKYMETGP